MKILLVSDTHSNNEAIDLLQKTYPHMDIYLHLGDSETDEYHMGNFRTVRGNMDYYGNFPDYLLIPTPFGNMYATHKPIMNDKLFQQQDVRIFVHGHTHIRKFINENGLIVVNPGAVTFPRDKYDGSFAIMEITPEKVDVEFHTLEEIIS